MSILIGRDRGIVGRNMLNLSRAKTLSSRCEIRGMSLENAKTLAEKFRGNKLYHFYANLIRFSENPGVQEFAFSELTTKCRKGTFVFNIKLDKISVRSPLIAELLVAELSKEHPSAKLILSLIAYDFLLTPEGADSLLFSDEERRDFLDS